MEKTKEFAFIQAFREKYSDQIKAITQSEETPQFYYVELNEGEDKVDFFSSAIAFSTEPVDFDSPMNLFIYNSGDDKEDSINIDFNYDHENGAQTRLQHGEDLWEAFEISVDGVLYTVEPEIPGDHKVFRIFEAGIPIGSVLLDTTNGAFNWRSKELISDEMAIKIGNAIEDFTDED